MAKKAATKPTKVVNQPIKIIKTNTVIDVINVTRDMGDKLATGYEATGDLKVAEIALKAYNTALSGSKVQLIYKKFTGKPTSIPFLED